MQGMVFDIQKFSIHDGPGIRTTVFLKGCPLKCHWCHNPESQSREPEISFQPEKCMACGWCFEQCSSGCHQMEGNTHILRREGCTRCGICVERCWAGALTRIGREMTVEAVLAEVEKDRPFYENSGGGMTLSGGEPMHQFAFTSALLAEGRRKGLHTCMETCGYAQTPQFLSLLKDVDLFLFDLKETDPERHRQYTGGALQPILDNLSALDQAGAAIILRCPVIPGLNDREEHFQAISAVAGRFRHIEAINLMPYHPLGESKLAHLGKPGLMEGKSFPDEKTVEAWIRTVQSGTDVKVTRG